jgi:HK97 gp10 family phage protein
MVQGMDKVRRRLVDEIPQAVRVALEAAMVEAADLVVAAARLRVPVRTGELAGTIRHHGVKEGRRGGLYVAVTAGDETTVEKSNGKPYQVARLVEFGTVRAVAEPFLLPAYRATRRRAQTRMRRAVRDAIVKAN